MPPCSVHLVADARFGITDVGHALNELGVDPNRAISAAERVSTRIFSSHAAVHCEAAAARLQPLTHGCPELHDCAQPAGALRGIENARYGRTCLTVCPRCL